jgi:hypothetical protein
VRDYFSQLCIADEFLIPTLLMHVAPAKGPMNHFIQRFDHAHPGRIEDKDIEQLKAIPAFFARKFPDDPAAPIRIRVLDELVGNSLPVDSSGTASEKPQDSNALGAPGASQLADGNYLAGFFGQGKVAQ